MIVESLKKHEVLALIFITAAAFCVGISTTATTITYLMAFACILFSTTWLTAWRSITANPALLSFWMLFALYLIGLLYTDSSGAQAFKDLQKMHWLLITPFLALVIRTPAWRRRILNAFLTAMTVTLLLSFAKKAGLPLKPFFPNVPGINVFFGHIVQTFFLNVAAFIAGYRCLFEARGRYAYALFFLAVLVNVLFLEESVTGYLTFFTFLICLLVFRFKRKQLAGAAVVLVLLGAAFLTSSSLHWRLHDIDQHVHQYRAGQTLTSVGLRLAMWHNAWTLIQKRPWFGYGTGGIRAAMQENLTPAQIQTTRLIDYVEFTPLNFLLEFGVLGLLIFLIALGCQVKMCWSLPREYQHLMLAFLINYIMASLFNCFFVSFCETHLYSILASVAFSAKAK